MIEIRPLAESDIEAVLTIQTSSPESAGWSEQSYRSLAAGDGGGLCLVADVDHQAAGFAVFRLIQFEAELLNLAVLPDLRRHGIGTLLLSAVLRRAAESGAASIYLEVRQSNAVALTFYRRFGFESRGRRPGYYANPSEDALVLFKELGQKELGQSNGKESPLRSLRLPGAAPVIHRADLFTKTEEHKFGR